MDLIPSLGRYAASMWSCAPMSITFMPFSSKSILKPVNYISLHITSGPLPPMSKIKYESRATWCELGVEAFTVNSGIHAPRILSYWHVTSCCDVVNSHGRSSVGQLLAKT